MAKVVAAYGDTASRAFGRVAALLRDDERLSEVLSSLDAGEGVAADVAAVLRQHASGALAGLPFTWSDQSSR